MTDNISTSTTDDEYLDYLNFKSQSDREIAQLQAQQQQLIKQMDQLTLTSAIAKEVRAVGGTDDIADLIAPIILAKASKKRDGSWAVNGQSLGDAIDDLRSSDALRSWLKPAAEPKSSLSPEGYIRTAKRY